MNLFRMAIFLCCLFGAYVLGGVSYIYIQSAIFQPDGGANIKCIEDARLCVGQDLDAGDIDVNWDALGGLRFVDCPQKKSDRPGLVRPLDAEFYSCLKPSSIYVFYSDVSITRIHVSERRVTRIDRFRRHVIDL